MTRFLSESLQAPEPLFRTGLRHLERNYGAPAHDIRVTAEIKQQLRATKQALRLEAHDTTAEELYHTLLLRVQKDDARLVRTLQTLAATHVSAEANVGAGMVHALKSLPESGQCFALKTASFKQLMQKMPPKKALKQLGYRSVASFIKHESPVAIMTIAALNEDARWHQQLRAAYKKLQPKDFESRRVSITQADTSKWPEMAEKIVHEHKQPLLTFKELGAIVLLPISHDVPAGTVTACLALATGQLNEIRAASAYLKLSQVREGFGEAVQRFVAGEAQLNAQLLGRAVPCHLMQRYYAQSQAHFNEAVFEPHLQLEDMHWRSVEQLLANIEPQLAFWHQKAHVALLHDGRPVSCNLIDVALNLCNRLPFEQRLSHHFQQSLWHELLFRYLQPDTIEQSIISELHPQLAAEYAIA